MRRIFFFFSHSISSRVEEQSQYEEQKERWMSCAICCERIRTIDFHRCNRKHLSRQSSTSARFGKREGIYVEKEGKTENGSSRCEETFFFLCARNIYTFLEGDVYNIRLLCAYIYTFIRENNNIFLMKFFGVNTHGKSYNILRIYNIFAKHLY